MMTENPICYIVYKMLKVMNSVNQNLLKML